ncbi:MAG: hypothetical protein OQK99_14710, partial [Gammaproteobacteria bacterium]|nr:hypothetical protein [Gammaproteobacteria bacterium]
LRAGSRVRARIGHRYYVPISPIPAIEFRSRSRDEAATDRFADPGVGGERPRWLRPGRKERRRV